MTVRTRRVGLALTDPADPSDRPTTSLPATVTAVVHTPTPAAPIPVLLVPGAGGSLDSEPLVALAEVVATAGHRVVRANLPHHERGGRAPRASTSVPAFAAILAAARRELGVDETRTWVLGGRSYGGRVASMAIADGLPAAGLLCSGYPLHPPGDPDQLRVAHWPDIGVPVLFVQGDADPMADLALLRRHRRKLPRRSGLVVVPGGDHALRITRARSPDGTARSPAAALQTVGPEVAAWLHGLESEVVEPDHERDGGGPDD
ncbi:MAG: alpha/beta fold hydrolase [Nitriliruptoraceae bacterium]